MTKFIEKMSRLDLVIFGATGFSGKRAVAEMVRLAEDYPSITWGVAGRCKEKLETFMAKLAIKTSSDLSQVKIIIADVRDENSLRVMCKQTKLLVNCCGPYRFLGEPVVKAAIHSVTHYVDISGEPQFMESMQLKYQQIARKAGVYVICGCGFDSIPADLGVLFLQQNFGGTLNTVEAYLSFKTAPGMWMETLRTGSIHYGTWESYIYTLAHSRELPALRGRLFRTPLSTLTPQIEEKWFHLRGGITSACVPLFTSDSSIVYRTQRRLHETTDARPAQYKGYLQLGLVQAMLIYVAAVYVALMSVIGFTRNLLLRYPRFFSMGIVSRKGPSEALMNSMQFQLELIGEGWDDPNVKMNPRNTTNKRVVAKVCGVNPRYGAGMVALLVSAVTILRERELMPPPGGVMTPGFAFGNTNIIENLNKRKFTFQLGNNNSD